MVCSHDHISLFTSFSRGLWTICHDVFTPGYRGTVVHPPHQHHRGIFHNKFLVQILLSGWTFIDLPTPVEKEGVQSFKEKIIQRRKAMANKSSSTQQKQEIESESSGWWSILAGSIFILTCLFILGFFWQSILSYVLTDWGKISFITKSLLPLDPYNLCNDN